MAVNKNIASLHSFSQSRLSFRLLLQSLPSMSQSFQVAFRSVLSFLPKNGSPIALEGGILPLRPLGELISLALAKKALPSSIYLGVRSIQFHVLSMIRVKGRIAAR